MKVTTETRSREQVAIRHAEEMECKYSEFIKLCIANSKVYRPTFNVEDSGRVFTGTKIEINSEDVMTCVNKHISNEDKVAVLNFASYKEPGGYFIKGYLAQEEAICYETILYNVLKEFQQSYYNYNLSSLNKGLYHNKAIYSRDVLVHNKNNWSVPIGTVDVITCAAPNVTRGLQYGSITQWEANETIADRIEYILNIAVNEKVDILILGAFGCGVFGNDPYFVAKCFHEKLYGKFYGKFKEVYFPIPNGRDLNNYTQFTLRFTE